MSKQKARTYLNQIDTYIAEERNREANLIEGSREMAECRSKIRRYESYRSVYESVLAD